MHVVVRVANNKVQLNRQETHFLNGDVTIRLHRGQGIAEISKTMSLG